MPLLIWRRNSPTTRTLEEHYDIILDDMFSFTMGGVILGQDNVIDGISGGLRPDGTTTEPLTLVVKDNRVSLWTEVDDTLVELNQ